MSAHHVVADVLLAAALLITVASVFGALVLRTANAKLHYLTPITSVAAPLFGAALVVENGWGLTAGLDLLIVGLLAVSGPALEISIGRVIAQRDGVIIGEGPQ